MLRLLSIAALSSALAGCVTTSGTPAGTCPSLPAYSPAQQKQAAAELRALPPNSEISVMVTDYGRVRDVCRLK